MIGDRLHGTRGGRHTAGLVLAGVLGANLMGCSSEATTPSANDKPATTSVTRTGQVFTDKDFGFNFTYPKDWSEGEPKDDAAQSAGGKPGARAAVGLDNDNAILMLRYDLSTTWPRRSSPTT